MESEQNEKMGKFISELRKSRGMTQKELAEKLKVTDKAVSKWERGLSSPDISLLMPLAEILDVTASELLEGRRETKEVTEETQKENTVKKALLYSGRSTEEKLEKAKRITMILFAAAFVITAITCLICDFCISGSLSWSLIVILSLLFSWVLFVPFFHFKSKKLIVKKTLIVLSVAVIPYLLVLSWILDESTVFVLGFRISVLSLIGIWCMYAAFHKLWNRKFLAGGIAVLAALPLTVGINHCVDSFYQVPSARIFDDMIQVICIVGLALILFFLDYVTCHREKI